MYEFTLVDRTSLLFEKASGSELHRDPRSGKVKFLPLGRWRGVLEEEDLPVRYVKVSEHLDMLGVKLRGSFIQTRKTNCDETYERLRLVIGSWKGGRLET